MNFDIHTPMDGEELIIPSGIHRLTSPIRLTGHNIRIVGEDGAVLQATRSLAENRWTEMTGGIYWTDIDGDADALYIGGRKYRMARYPKYISDDVIFGGFSPDCISPGKTAQWNNPTGGWIHAMHRHLWGGYTYRITGKNTDGTLQLDGGWQNNRQMGMHDNYRYAENIFEELTEAGEWYFDAAAHRIYVIPYPEDAPEDAEIAVSHCFFELNGCEHITIENLTFARSSRTFMQTREPLLRSDWTIFRGGAVRMENVRDVTLDRCTFTDIGSNAVFVSGACEDVRVTRCHFNGIGASGVCFIGLPECVRNPLFEYNETLPFSELDLTPGPQTEQYPRRCLVEDCLISRTGQVEKQSAGVQISMASEICVRNSTICHTPRAGINISEGTFGGHRIEGCDVFDTVRETGDHGSFNSWGRDRFWHAEGLRDEDVHCYAKLDCIKPNVIRTSRFRCDHGWDIDLDDGSSNYIIEHNLCLSGGIKLREGCFRTVRRNITVNNTVHFHVWYPDSHDIVTDNIVFILYAPIGMPECWGTCVDHNILHTPGMTASAPALTLQSLSGQDSTSVMLDCMFQNPETGDFIPLSDSALLSGFAEFPREFGVRYAPLRAIADTPDMTLSTEHREETVFVRQWHGAYVKNITSDGEMSVYGTAGHNGVLVLAVSDGTDACEYGLCSGDVIVDVAGTPVSSVDDLTENLIQPITVLRRQMHIVLEKIG